MLQWSTSSEQNTRDFAIQHSVDGLRWSEIATVAAAGNSTTERTYQYLHLSPAHGLNFYRLLQRDIDGRSSYSEIRSISIEKIKKILAVINNIAGPSAFTLSKPAVLKLHTSDGRLLWKKQFAGGMTTVTGIPPGVYLLSANGQTERLIIR